MNRLKNNKGITGIDLTISIIVLTIFAGLIVGLMVNNYNVAIEIQKGANAMSYATMILEKVDEKAYEKVTNNFVQELGDEISINSDYTVNLEVNQADDKDYVKRVTVKVTYTVNNEEKSLEIRKLKIKEIS
ncbi:unknown [Clostridium sp. CAG:780]|nr:unknown [Clostridium sp. CAG:780]